MTLKSLKTNNSLLPIEQFTTYFHLGVFGSKILFLYFFPFQYKNTNAKKKKEILWKDMERQDIVKLIVCPLLDELNLIRMK